MAYKKLINRHFKVNQVKWKISRKGLFYIALNFPAKEGQRKAFAIYLLSVHTPIETITKDLGITNRMLHAWLTSFNEKGPVFFADNTLELTLDRIDERSGLSPDDISSEDIVEEKKHKSESDIVKESNKRLKSLKSDASQVVNKPILDDGDINSMVDNSVNEFLRHNGKLRGSKSPKTLKRDILKDHSLPNKPEDVNTLAVKILEQAHKEGKKTF